MKRNLLFVSLLLLCASGASAQKSLDNTNNIFSVDSLRTKKKAIKIYPNPSYGTLSVSATSSALLHFYVFDLEGTLIFQAVLNYGEKKTIENLKKGTYLYDVFEKDESVEEGKIIVK